MRIGVNAQPLTHPLTGIGQYTFALLKELVQSHPEVEWILYAGAPLTTSYFDNIPHVKIHHHAFKSKIQYLLFFLFALNFTLKKDKIDLFWSPTHLLPIIKPKNTPFLISIHDLVFKKVTHTMKTTNALKEKCLFFPSLKMADSVFVLSKTTESDLTHSYKLKCNPILCYPAYTPSTPIKTKSHPLVMGKYILCVCTKEPRKNLMVLLQAYLLAPLSIKDEYTLVFCGGMGWKSEQFIEALTSAAKSYPIINFDYVTDQERDNLYAHATLFVFPTLYEGFGMPVIEAMSYGLPVIVSDIPIMREVAGNSALYADPHNPQTFSDQMKDMLHGDGLLSKYAALSLERFQLFNSWKSSSDRIWEEMQRYEKCKR